MTPTRVATFCLLLACVWLGDRPARACGPDLTRAILWYDHPALCEAPALGFGPQLERLAPARIVARGNTTSTTEAELDDLRAALLEQGVATGEIEIRLEAVREHRAWLEDRTRHDQPAPPLPELPAEFRLYLEGARAWHLEGPDWADLAREKFDAILELPRSERRYRSVWAAYMLAHLRGGPGCRSSDREWKKVRELAAAGFVDTHGLAAASYGEQALCWRSSTPSPSWIRALELYLDQAATGDLSGEVSVRWLLGDLFEPDTDPQVLAEVAADPRLREVVGAWLASRRHDPELTLVWLEQLERAGLERAAGSGPLAWAAYRSGDINAAERWAKLDPDDLLARWVLAKLELRRGEVERAAEALARIEAELADDPQLGELAVGEWRFSDWDAPLTTRRTAAAELGALELRRQNFEAALASFVRAGSYLDAAYVAEQVLTLDELERFVERDAELADDAAGPASIRAQLRWLFARRLARAGQWDRALPHYPENWRAVARAHADDLRALRDPGLDDIERARLLWRTATRTRSQGMELQGTEIEPDWTYYGGAFEPDGLWESRSGDVGPTGPTAAEIERVQIHREDGPRFHYRWVAAELGWQTAELLPDQHPATARVLCIAGGWIADRDPKQADRFYQAMIERNGAVEIAQWADEARWFPDPQACSLRGIDFARPPLHVPVSPPPSEPAMSRRELARHAWPLAAFLVLIGIVGLLLVPTRHDPRGG